MLKGEIQVPVMALINRTIYPRFPTTFNAKDLHRDYTPTPQEVDFVRRIAKGDAAILNVLAMLKVFQKLHYFPHPVEMPLAITRHIHACLKLNQIEPTAYPRRSLYRHRPLIREYLGFALFDKKARRAVVRAVYEAALSRDDPADLINVAVQTLFSLNYELPAFSTLERMVGRIRQLVNNNYFRTIASRIKETERVSLDKLLVVVPKGPQRYSDFNRLKELPQSATLHHLKDLLKHLDWLLTLGKVEKWLDEIPRLKIKFFAAQAKAVDVRDMDDFLPNKRYTLLVCLIFQARVTTRDNLVEMFIRRLGTLHKRGQEELELLKLTQRGLNENLLDTFTEILELAGNHSSELPEESWEDEEEDDPHGFSVNDATRQVEAQVRVDQAVGAVQTSQPSTDKIPNSTISDELLGRQVRQILNKQGGPDALLEACYSLSAYNGNNYLPLLPAFYKSHRGTLFKLVRTLKIHSATHNYALQKALELILDKQTSRARWLPDTLDLDFATELWQKTVRVRKAGSRKYRLDHRLLEICVFSYLGFELRTGDMYVEGSEDYADYRAQLLSWKECEPLVAQYCEQVGLPKDGTELVKQLKAWLGDTAKTVDENFPTNQDVTLNEKGLPTLKKGKRKELPPNYLALREALHRQLPARGLLQILSNTEHWCNWTRYFGPLSGNEPKLERAVEKYILTVFAHATGLGATQTAAHLGGKVSAFQLSFLNRTHITSTKLEAANTQLINAYSRFDLPYNWGNPKVAVADGTKIDLPDNSLFSQHHFRYGGNKGGIAYHHISDTYVALFTHFIPCSVWEAIYIIDGLLKNRSELTPDTLHADTQGQSTPVFGLAYLLGIKLMPRIRNWQDLIFYRAEKAVHYQHIDALFRETVDWTLLSTHWPDLMRVVLSIKAGKILPSALLRKLGHYSRKNKLYQAFAELGRVIRTIYLLEYITDLALRQGISASTNKIESFNKFSDWITFGGEGLLTVFDGEEREKRVKFTELVANAIMLQNVVDITQLLKELRAQGQAFTKADVSAFSPYLTRHIRRFGEYILDLEDKPEPLTDEVLRLDFEEEAS